MPATPAMPAILSVRELAEYLGVPTGTIYNWNSQGHGPTRIRVGRHVRYRVADVEAWLTANVK